MPAIRKANETCVREEGGKIEELEQAGRRKENSKRWRMRNKKREIKATAPCVQPQGKEDSLGRCTDIVLNIKILHLLAL